MSLSWSDTICYAYVTWYDIPQSVHYYVSLRCKKDHGTERIDLEYEMNEEEAADFNRRDNNPELGGYSAGDTTRRWLDKEKMLAAVVEQWQTICPSAKVLLMGESGVCDPMEIRAGLPDEDMELLNHYWEEFESFDGWNCAPDEEDEVQEISDNWESLMEAHLEKVNRRNCSGPIEE